MITKYTVLGAVILYIVSSQECISSCFTRKQEFTECASEIKARNDTNDLVYLTFFNGTSRDSAISLVLSLICNQQQTKWTSLGPPYCAHISSEEKIVQCGICNCTETAVYIISHTTNTTLSATLIINILKSEKFQIALNLGGVYSVTSNNLGSGISIFGEVPIASWVCLVLGVIISGLMFAKPLWWDKIVSKVFKKVSRKNRKQMS